MDNIIYWKDGKQYIKIGRCDTIVEGAMHSYDYGELMPILNEETIGDIPASFSAEREFYNPLK